MGAGGNGERGVARYKLGGSYTKRGQNEDRHASHWLVPLGLVGPLRGGGGQ